MEGVIACTRAGKCREEVAARFASWRELQEEDKEKSNPGMMVTPTVSKTERVWLLQGLEKDNVALRADSSCL